MTLLKDLIAITMPNRSFILCFSYAAGMMMGGMLGFSEFIFGILMFVCIYCSQAVFNNIVDMEGDKVNAPDRPLARGSISPAFAWSLMFFLIAIGMAFAFLSAPFMPIVAVAIVLLGLAYSKFTKSRGWLSYVTLVTTHINIPLLSGYLIFNGFDIKIGMALAFMYLTEILAFSIKDYKDIEGDAKVGLKTLPIVLTPEKAAKITFVGLCLPLLLVWLPWHVLGLSAAFLFLYLIAGSIRSLFAVKLLQNPSPENAGKMLKSFRYILLLQMLAWCIS